MGFGCLSSAFAIFVMVCYVLFLPIAFGLMTYGDYEKWDCYASPDYDEPWLITTEAPPEDYSNVASSFTMINTWGFYNFMAPLGIGCLACFSFSCLGLIGTSRSTKRDCTGGQSAFLFMLLTLSFLSQLIALVVIRFAHPGRVCSGDYDSEISIFSLEQKEPYLHLKGTWFFYYLATLMYGTGMAITGISFIAGTKD